MAVVGEGRVSGIQIKDTKTGKDELYPTQGLFLAIGHKPNTDFLKGFIELDEKGYIITKKPKVATEAMTCTSVAGVFAAGDCVDVRYRQAIVAAGQGCMAALDAQKFLEEVG